MGSNSLSMLAASLLLGLVAALQIKGVQPIGVCYGMEADNLPPHEQVINLYKSKNIGQMRLYNTNPTALKALRGSGIQVIIGASNLELPQLAADPSFANDWFQQNVRFYLPDVKIHYISVGNEVIPGNDAHYVLPAMQNIYSAIQSAGLQDQIKVSTSVALTVLGTSFPPSQGSFSTESQQYLEPIVRFLVSNRAPLMANVYPYFSYVDNPRDISLSYALFTSPSVVVQDGQFGYMNLFDAMMDAMYSALERVGGSSVEIVASESGWPSAGNADVATIENAKTYNSNLIKHVTQGTPKRAGRSIETYVFAMFNENQKPVGVEQNFGLFYPNQQLVYEVNFS